MYAYLITDLPPPLVFFLECNLLGQELAYRVHTRSEYCRVCQEDVYRLETIIQVEALIKDGVLEQVGFESHRFTFDYKHPCCPLRAYQHGELRASLPEKESKVAPTTIVKAAMSVVETVHPSGVNPATLPVEAW